MAKEKLNFGFFDNFEITKPSEDKIEEEQENIQEGIDPAEEIEEPEVEVEEKKPSKKKEEVEEEEELSEETTEEVEPNEGDEPEEKFSFQPLVEDLEEQGILRGIEGKEYSDDEEGFRERFKDSLEAEKQAWIESIPEEYRHLTDFIKAGKDVRDFIKTVEPIDYESVDLEDENVQKNLITEHLSSLGYKDAYIKKKLETFETLNELQEEATVAKEFLVEKSLKDKEAQIARAAEEAQERELQAQESLKNIEKIIYETDEIAGFKLTKKDQKAFRDYLLAVDKKTGKTPIQMNDTPERRLKLAYLDFIDYHKDDLEKKVKSSVSKNLQKVVSRYSDKNAKSTSNQPVRERQESKKIPDIFGVGQRQIEIED